MELGLLSPKRAEETHKSVRTYWVSLSHWSWSCRGPCPRFGHVGSRFLLQQLEMILKGKRTSHVIRLQSVILTFSICPDVGHLWTVLPSFRYSDTGSHWNPKPCGCLLPLTTSFSLGVHEKGVQRLTLNSYLLAFALAVPPTWNALLPPSLCIQISPNSPSPGSIKSCDLQSGGHGGGGFPPLLQSTQHLLGLESPERISLEPEVLIYLFFLKSRPYDNPVCLEWCGKELCAVWWWCLFFHH